jgi:hypothetical protein
MVVTVVTRLELKAIQAITGNSAGLKKKDVRRPVSMNKAPN